MKLGDVFIDGTGLYLPPLLKPLDEVVAEGLYDAERHAGTQLASVAVSLDVFPPEMAVAAGKEALAASSHGADEIGAAFHAHMGAQGIGGWHAASYVHRFVVGNSCPVYEIEGMSNGGLASLTLGSAYLRASGSDRAALVTTGDRFEDIPFGRFYFDDVFILGDGAAACVLSLDRGFARLESIFTYTDTTLEELHRGDHPFKGEQTMIVEGTSYKQRKEEYFSNGHTPDETTQRFGIGSASAVLGALADAEVELGDIDRWILPNMGRYELETYYLPALNVPIERTCWSFGSTVGHLGAGDQLACLHQLRTTGALRPGQRCALVGIGSGFSWSCAVLEVLEG